MTAAPAPEPALEARGLSAGYLGVPVLHDLNLQVAPGEVVALLGTNGAGKTTALLTLAGDLKPLKGEVLLHGETTTAPMHRRVQRGLALITDDRALFSGLSCHDNLRLGRGSVEAALAAFPELRPLLGTSAGLLSGGEQQMLALGRVLAAEPTVVLADELSLGLAPKIVTRLLAAVRASADRGAAVLLVEQHVRLVLGIADRAYVLRQGSVALSGTARELRANLKEIERSYLSAPVDA